jgi:hypothetical protein
MTAYNYRVDGITSQTTFRYFNPVGHIGAGGDTFPAGWLAAVALG